MIQYIIAAGIGALLGSGGKKPKKMGDGGKTQGYNSRLDESLSMRHGAGRKKQQTRKDRRDESAAMERSMGRRKYASVSTMDKGRRKMAHGGEVVLYESDGMAELGGSRYGEIRLSKDALKNAEVIYYPSIDLVAFKTKNSEVHAEVNEDEDNDYLNFIVVNGKRKYLVDMERNGEIDKIIEGMPKKMAQGGTIVGAGKSGLDKIKKTSKDNPSQMYMVTDDNYKNIGRFYLKNGKFAKKTVANADYDFFRNKVSLRPKSDVIYKAIAIEGKGGYYAKGGYVRPKNLALPERHYQTLADALDKVIDHYGEDAIKDYLERNGAQGRYAVYRQATNRIWMDDDNANLRGDRFGIKHDPDWRTRTRMYTDKHFDSATKSILAQKLGNGRKRMALGGMAGRISPMEMQQIILDKTGKLLDPSTQAFANEAGALGYLYALFGDYYTKSMQKGGKTSSAEERAFAEYMEDYGVGREQAEEQFLGEFRNKEEWAAEYVDDVGGIEQFIDPERFLKVDKIGFREWAMNMADALSSDLDDYELEDRAERHGLKFEYMEAEEMGGDAMKNFRREIEEKEYDEQYDYFMSEGESVEGVLDLLGNYGGHGIEDASDLYVVEVDYDEVADALENDGFVFIEEDFKTFVFDPNMRRGGRTKCTSCNKNRMKKGGRTKSRKKVSDFDKLAMKVAARYRAEGKSNKEAMEIGRGTAAKVYRQQQAKGGAKRRKGRK